MWLRPADPALTDSPLDPRIMAALTRLPARQRQVVTLRLLLDLDTSCTAEVLGISPSAVKAHLARAIATLRSDLSPHRHATGTPGGCRPPIALGKSARPANPAALVGHYGTWKAGRTQRVLMRTWFALLSAATRMPSPGYWLVIGLQRSRWPPEFLAQLTRAGTPRRRPPSRP